jgi:hypothetical protein
MWAFECRGTKCTPWYFFQFHTIFDEAEPEAEELHSEGDDMESPILEEDEDEGEQAEPDAFAPNQSRELLRSED